jgi:hypothetical protein
MQNTTDPTNDTEASFSNFGTCVKLFGPGVNILSAGIASDTATKILSGTSQATPHVTGVAARYLETHPLATPAAVFAAIHAADDGLSWYTELAGDHKSFPLTPIPVRAGRSGRVQGLSWITANRNWSTRGVAPEHGPAHPQDR